MSNPKVVDKQEQTATIDPPRRISIEREKLLRLARHTQNLSAMSAKVAQELLAEAVKLDE